MTTTFASKIKSGRLHYELFYCSRDNEESGKFDQHSFAEVEFDPHLTPDGLIEKALKEMKNNGHVRLIWNGTDENYRMWMKKISTFSNWLERGVFLPEIND